jgi:hypothetical protein
MFTAAALLGFHHRISPACEEMSVQTNIFSYQLFAHPIFCPQTTSTLMMDCYRHQLPTRTQGSDHNTGLHLVALNNLFAGNIHSPRSGRSARLNYFSTTTSSHPFRHKVMTDKDND